MSDAVVNGLAGAGGGIVSQLLTYPLQAVNTRQQTERQAKQAHLKVSEAGPASSTGPPRKNGTAQEILRVIRQEGWGGLYRGLSPSLVGTAASQGVYYYFYQVFRNQAEKLALRKKKRGKGDGTVGMFGSLVVAALAGCANVLLTNPIWVVVTRMQTQVQAQQRAAALAGLQNPRPSADWIYPSPVVASTNPNLLPVVRPQGAFETVRELYDEAGILGLWKGVFPTLIMVCNPSIQFMIYESLLKHVTAKRAADKRGLKTVSSGEVFLFGAIAKLGATVATYPLLVVKSRLQAKQEIGRDKSSQYTGTLDAIVKMVQYEGLAGFYKGMSTKIVQSVMAAAVLFMIKEELVKSATILVARRKKIGQAASVKV
ncbi:unnamed protein product [Sphagnum balticum]